MRAVIASLAALAAAVVGITLPPAPAAAAPAGVLLSAPVPVEAATYRGRAQPHDLARTRQPVVAVTLRPDGVADFGAASVTLTVRSPGESRIFAEPLAGEPIGTTTAELVAQEGVAVFYVEHTAPGSAGYTVATADGRSGTAQGTVAERVAATERVATMEVAARPRSADRFSVTARARDLYALPVRGDVQLEVFAFGPDAADALPGGVPGTLPAPAGTAALVQRFTARDGELRLDLTGIDEEVTVLVRVADAPAREVLDWPAALMRLPFTGAPTREQHDRAWDVTSYNVHFGVPQNRSFDETAAPAALREVGTDVALLQEVDDNFGRSGGVDLTASYAHQLGMVGVYAPSIAVQPRQGSSDPQLFGNAVLSRDPIEAARVVKLPRLLLPRRFTEARTVLTATVKSPVGRRVVADTHLDLNQGERILQGRAIQQVVAQEGTAFAALGGDLNTSQERPDFQLLASTPGLYDAWPVAGEGPGNTFRAIDPFIRIDVVFPSERLTTSGAVVGTLPNSDHLPVRATLTRH